MRVRFGFVSLLFLLAHHAALAHVSPAAGGNRGHRRGDGTALLGKPAVAPDRGSIWKPNTAPDRGAYDAAARLTSLFHTRSAGAGGATIASFPYDLDNAGNRTKLTLNGGDYLELLHDADDQLTKETQERRRHGADAAHGPRLGTIEKRPRREWKLENLVPLRKPLVVGPVTFGFGALGSRPPKPHAPPQGPGLAVEPAQIYVGRLALGSEVGFRVCLRNVSKQIAAIASIETGCGCVDVRLTRRWLGAGDVAYLDGTVRADGKPGRKETAIRLFLSRPEVRSIRIPISADIEPPGTRRR